MRDWLSANHVLFLGGGAGGNVLVDTGYGACVDETVARLQGPDALDNAPLDRIVNTHVHSDHVGGNARLARLYRCPISVPAGERAVLDAWDDRALLLDYADQRCERFAYHDTIEPGDTLELGGMAWTAVATPGHDMGALVFYAPQERILISGDALWRNGFGFLEPEPGSLRRLEAARCALDRIAALDVRLVIPGHGPPFTAFGEALERSFARLESYFRDPQRMAWYGLKACFVFSLLDRGRLPLSGLDLHLARVGLFRDINREFIRKPWRRLADDLLADLQRAGAVRRQGDDVVPA